MTEVEDLYTRFEEIVQNRGKFENSTIEKFATKNIENNLVEKIHRLITGPNNVNLRKFDNVGLLELMANYLNAQNQICTRKESPQKVLYDFFMNIQLVQKKSYIMTEFSYLILNSHGKGNFTYESSCYRKNVASRFGLFDEHMRRILSKTSNQLWRCDPGRLIENVTYFEIYQVRGSADQKNILENDYLIRYFDLWQVYADTKANKVVTGIRFVKQHNTIKLQIQECELLKYGNINQSTVEWKPINHYKVFYGERNRDYFVLTTEQRSIELGGGISAPDGYAVTGVQFKFFSNRLKLQVRATKLNFTTGMLNSTENRYLFKRENSKNEFQFNKFDTPLSEPGQFVKFQDLVKNSAESTITFIDAQDVVSTHPVPLQGLELFLKGSKDFGGLLKLKIKTFNYVPYI